MRTDIVISTFPVKLLLELTHTSVQYMPIIEMLCTLKVISSAQPLLLLPPDINPSFFTIIQPSVQLHLDVTFTAIGTVLSLIGKKDLISKSLTGLSASSSDADLLYSSSDWLGDKAATDKIKKYKDLMLSSSGMSNNDLVDAHMPYVAAGRPPMVLLPLQFANNGRPHGITSRFLEHIIARSALASHHRYVMTEYSPALRPAGKTWTSHKGYLRRQLSGLIQRQWAHGMFTIAKHSRSCTSHLCDDPHDFDEVV